MNFFLLIFLSKIVYIKLLTAFFVLSNISALISAIVLAICSNTSTTGFIMSSISFFIFFSASIYSSSNSPTFKLSPSQIILEKYPLLFKH